MEDNNNSDEIYEDENMERLKKASKDAAKKATKQVGKAARKAIKEAFKKLLKLIPPYVWAIIIGVILGIILLASFWYTITKGTFDSISDISKSHTSDNSGNIKKITTIDEGNRKLVIDSKTFIDDIDQWFEDNKIEPSTLGFYDDEDYMTLVKFLEAETVSSFPDLRERSKIGTPVKEGELQGIVQFKRKYSDGSEQLLEYKEYKEFRRDLAKLGVKLDEEETQDQIYFTKGEVEKAYNELKTYFTLDEDFNLIIVSLETYETKVTYSGYAKEEGNSDQNTYDFTIKVTRVNYQSVIQKYTMPFEFPLSLLLITRNPEFCVEVAKLAMTSQEGEKVTKVSFEPKIVVDIQDNLTSTYIKEDYGYTANFKLQDYVKYYTSIRNKKGVLVHQESGITLDEYPIEVEKVVSASSYRITENWIDTITPQLCVSEAITWIADYTSVYNKIDDVIGPDVTNSPEGDDGGYSEVPDYHKYLANQTFNYSLPSSTTATSTMVSTLESEEKKILEKKTGKNTEITKTTNTTKYNKSSSKVEPKWERFLSLLKIEEKEEKFNLKDLTKNDKLIKYEIENSGKSASPENNLLTGIDTLYELLASNTKTVTFEEIMRNLIGIYTGEIKADESEFDFSIYEPGEFISVGEGGNILYGSIQLTDDDFEILCKITSAERGGGTKQQQEYVVSVILNRVLSSKFPNTVKDVVFAPGQFQPTRNGAYERAVPSETTKAAVRNVIENGDTTGGALYFCTPGAAAKDSWWSSLIFLFNDSNGTSLSSHNFYTTPEGKSELEQYGGMPEIGTIGGGTIIQEAAAAHKYVEDNGYSYAQVGLTIPNGILNGRTIDCSSFVSWVLYRAGFTEFAGHQKNSAVFKSNPWGWQTINSISSAQPGDILVYNGHVEIYAGQVSGSKAIVYNCGGNSSIKSSAPKSSGHSINEIVKILRPPA